MTSTDRLQWLMERYGLTRSVVGKLIREHAGHTSDRLVFMWLAARNVPKYANACLVMGLYEAHYANTLEFLELVEALSEDTDGKRARRREVVAA